MSLAVVTGASSGIGRELAWEHARRGGDLVLAARRADALDELASALHRRMGVEATAVPCDLGTGAGRATLIDALQGRPVDVLINNAGFGGTGAFLDRPLDDDFDMIELNVKAVMALCHAVAPGMVARGGGRILNVGSTAGMMPGPMQATYFATKAFVQSFSLALDEELRDEGVTVTVLAPGYVETGFADRANMRGLPMTRSGRDASSVAKVGYEAMMAGRLHVVNERGLSVLTNWVIPFLPRRQVLRMMRRMQTRG